MTALRAVDLPGARCQTNPIHGSPRAIFGGGHNNDEAHSTNAPANYAQLRSAAEVFFTMQEFRKATLNKLRWNAVDPALLEVTSFHLKLMEKEADRAVLAAYRDTVPRSIQDWQEGQLGIGAHLLALLLGRIGDPLIATPMRWEGKGRGKRILVADGEPYERTVSQLWSYCGVDDPNRKMRPGISAEDLLALGSPRTKALVWNIASACVKAGVRSLDGRDDADEYDIEHREAISPYGEFYLARRRTTVDRVHPDACVRCGPAGRPAEIGSPWSRNHRQEDALRVLGKEILKDLWIADGGQLASDTQRRGAAGRPLPAGAQRSHGTQRRGGAGGTIAEEGAS